jgi:catechol 2,3-dioxygenase-like lactoylglutathione lyase family enzyme
MEILGIDNVLFAVGDLPAAVRFYTGLGLDLAFRRDDAGLALFRLGPEPPGLLVRRHRDGDPPAAGGRVWLEVRDARATASELAGTAGLGVPFAVATGWTVEVTDPYGNVVGFTDYQIRPSAARCASRPPAARTSSPAGR